MSALMTDAPSRPVNNVRVARDAPLPREATADPVTTTTAPLPRKVAKERAVEVLTVGTEDPETRTRKRRTAMLRLNAPKEAEPDSLTRARLERRTTPSTANLETPVRAEETIRSRLAARRRERRNPSRLSRVKPRSRKRPRLPKSPNPSLSSPKRKKATPLTTFWLTNRPNQRVCCPPPPVVNMKRSRTSMWLLVMPPKSNA